MKHGMNAYTEKEKRAMRRRNHIAKDLGSPKYRPRVIEHRRDILFDWEDEEYE